ncbi:MAG: hypothetical protein RL768_2478 [Nitrospirota bacterium]|jgi:uncharacterized protein (DUF362 family)
MTPSDPIAAPHVWTRRQVLSGLAVAAAGAAGLWGFREWQKPTLTAETFIGAAASYDRDLSDVMSRGFRELGVTYDEIKGKRILLKPNLVETSEQATHINTHPLVVRAAAEAFLRLGAQRVVVAEGPGHRRDTLAVLEESGLESVLYEDRIPFLDINYMEGIVVPNAGGRSPLRSLTFPALLRDTDWIVSVAKLKTHHWAGVTLSMKNLFGLMPGRYYGWPKNALHVAGIQECIVDIVATAKPHFAIIDGIVGMEGDGPIMGTPREAGVLIMGRNCTAVDATAARVMQINPHRVEYLTEAEDWLGPVTESRIMQRGEAILSVQKPFELVEGIPSQVGLRLS